MESISIIHIQLNSIVSSFTFHSSCNPVGLRRSKSPPPTFFCWIWEREMRRENVRATFIAAAQKPPTQSMTFGICAKNRPFNGRFLQFCKKPPASHFSVHALMQFNPPANSFGRISKCRQFNWREGGNCKIQQSTSLSRRPRRYSARWMGGI